MHATRANRSSIPERKACLLRMHSSSTADVHNARRSNNGCTCVLRARLNPLTQSNKELPPRAFLLRMLGNLKRTYMAQQDGPEQALRIIR